jgi:hypothetical protein
VTVLPDVLGGAPAPTAPGRAPFWSEGRFALVRRVLAGRTAAASPRRSHSTSRAGAGTGAGPLPSPMTPGKRSARGGRRTPLPESRPARRARTPQQASCLPAPRPARPFHRRQGPDRGHARRPAHHMAISLQHPHRMPGRDSQVNPDQPPVLRLAIPQFHQHLASPDSSASAAPQAATQRPRSQDARARQRLPLMCCNGPGPDPAWSTPSCGSSVARPAMAIKSARPCESTGLRTYASPPTGQAGMLMQPWNPRADQAPELLT